MADSDDSQSGSAGLISLDMGAFGSGSMNDPLRHAVGIRNAQDKSRMQFWESLPEFFQITVFHGEQDTALNHLRLHGSVSERLFRAKQIKDEGNELLRVVCASVRTTGHQPQQEKQTLLLKDMDEHVRCLQTKIAEKEKELKNLQLELESIRRKKDLQAVQENFTRNVSKQGLMSQDQKTSLEAAIVAYEKAAGLLRYLQCTCPNWKNTDGSYKGLEDKYLQINETALAGEGPEAEEARRVVTSCYLNIALAAQKLDNFDLMQSACTEVLSKLDSVNTKALYRRAQARVGPTGAMDHDRNAAIQDLMAAAQVAPQDKDVRELLTALRAEKKSKQATERTTFAGFFDRGSLSSSETANPATNTPLQSLDLKDPGVQRLLDIYPSANHFED